MPSTPDPTETLSRRTALKTIGGATTLIGGFALVTDPVAAQQDDEETQSTTNVRRLSSGGALVWEIDNDTVYEGQTTDGTRTRVAAYANKTLRSPADEPLCEWAGDAGEGVGVFWEMDSGAAVVLVTGNVARVRRTEFARTYAFEGTEIRGWPPEDSEVLLTAEFGEPADAIETDAEEVTDFGEVDPLTKAIIVILLEEECGLETDSPVM